MRSNPGSDAVLTRFVIHFDTRALMRRNRFPFRSQIRPRLTPVSLPVENWGHVSANSYWGIWPWYPYNR